MAGLAWLHIGRECVRAFRQEIPAATLNHAGIILTCIDRYLVNRIVPIMLVTLLIAAVVLLMDRLLQLLNLTIGAGVSSFVVVQMMVSLVPNYIRLVLPLGMFLGVFLCFRNLSIQSELHALQSSGISLRRLVKPAQALAIITTVLALLLTGYAEPEGRYTYQSLYFDVTNGLIKSGISEGVFVKLPNGYTIRVARSRDGGRQLSGFFGYRENADGSAETLTASQGDLIETATNDKSVLRLVNGVQTIWFPAASRKQVITFDTFELPFDLNDILRYRERGGDERELTLDELIRAYATDLLTPDGTDKTRAKDVGPRSKNTISFSAISAELHSRLVYAASILVMPFLAISLAIVSQRSSRSGGLLFGIVVLLAYQKIIEFGAKYAAVSTIPAAIVLWVPFVIFAGSAAILFARTDRSPGITPFHQFEQMFLGHMSRIEKFVRRNKAV